MSGSHNNKQSDILTENWNQEEQQSSQLSWSSSPQSQNNSTNNNTTVLCEEQSPSSSSGQQQLLAQQLQSQLDLAQFQSFMDTINQEEGVAPGNFQNDQISAISAPHAPQPQLLFQGPTPTRFPEFQQRNSSLDITYSLPQNLQQHHHHQSTNQHRGYVNNFRVHDTYNNNNNNNNRSLYNNGNNGVNYWNQNQTNFGNFHYYDDASGSQISNGKSNGPIFHLGPSTTTSNRYSPYYHSNRSANHHPSRQYGFGQGFQEIHNFSTGQQQHHPHGQYANVRPPPVVVAEGSNKNEKTQDEDFKEKLIAYARFNSNNSRMKEILSDVIMPDPRNIVSSTRVTALQLQVRALEAHLVLQEAELKKEENKWLERKKNLQTSTDEFKTKYSALLGPQKAEKTYKEFRVKYYLYYKSASIQRNQWEQTLAWAHEVDAATSATQKSNNRPDILINHPAGTEKSAET